MNHIKSTFYLISFFFFSLTHANVLSYFDQIKNDPNALYAFLRNMPKGGELHYHLAGGVYPETMLEIASKENYCLNPQTLILDKNLTSAIASPDKSQPQALAREFPFINNSGVVTHDEIMTDDEISRSCQGISAKKLVENQKLYAKTVKSWSMKDFIPGKESGHDHFFNTFLKFNSVVFDHRPELIADVMKTAAQQQEHYLELMILPDNGNSINFGVLLKNTSSLSQKRQLLLANKDFQNNIAHTAAETARILKQARHELHCEAHPQSEPCQIKINFLYYSLREQSLDNLFAQTLNAFEAVAHSQKSKGNLVGVNLVQPEDGIISLRDYHQQMLIYQYLHQMYPKVNIALHAGELTQEIVTPKDLNYHVHDALYTGQAQRIGHGVDIAYEQDAEKTLNYMATHHIAIEINLISNLKILNVSGANHPLHYYLEHHVPIVLSTDDEGILRTNLSLQYVEAVLNQGLDYQTLKQINRNALTYAFLPGKSIWSNADKAILNSKCKDLHSESCKKFIKKNEKAELQWHLEQKINTFEHRF